MPRPISLQFHPRAEHYAEMICALREAACSAEDLHMITGIAQSTLRVYLHAMHQTIPPVVYIEHWEKKTKYWIPYYRMQAQRTQHPDARKPVPETRAQARKRQRDAARLKRNEIAGKPVDGRALRHQHGPKWQSVVLSQIKGTL